MSLFLSYRREDSAGYAGRLCEHLRGVFGAEGVFMDVDDIAPGQDFAEAIERTISACQAVVVVIGPRWVQDLEQRSGTEDFVRHEVSVALRRGITVIPVLVGNSTMPAPAVLPGMLAALSRRQAVEIRDATFDEDLKVLVAALREVAGVAAAKGAAGPTAAGKKRWLWAAVAAALLLAGSAVLLRRGQPSVAPNPPPVAGSQPTAPAVAAANIDGAWIAEMQKDAQPKFRIRLNLVEQDGRLIGNVSYPTGDGAIQEGTRNGTHLAFSTVHTPEFASEPATIRWTGVIEGDAIRFTLADESGVATGIGRRAP